MINRREFLRTVGALGASLLLMVTGQPILQAGDATKDNSKYNVLFITVDDLRPTLGCYGDSVVKTPHLDSFAKSGTVFNRAYCQLPSCTPSRSSFMTGMRVETTGINSNRAGHFRKQLPKCITIPQHFKNHGFFTQEFGKVFHLRDPQSWSQPKWIPKPQYAYPIYAKPKTLELQKKTKVSKKPEDWWGYKNWVKTLSWEDPDVRDSVLFDGMLADRAIEVLAAKKNAPFFLAVGFFRPHLPFIAPKKYFELYPPETLQLPKRPTKDSGAPSFARHDSGELRSYTDIVGRPSKSKEMELLRAYYASVSYVDAQFGRVLKELDRLGLRQKTVVVVVSDHGYHFGEHGFWGKVSNFELSTRSTLIVSSPSQKNRGTKTNGLVELVDLYPTLCDLCGLPEPKGLEGSSFAPLLNDPKSPWKKAVFSQAKPKGVWGYTMRTDRYRYTEWKTKNKSTIEVYDHQNDPGENLNIANAPDQRTLVQELAEQFKQGWKKQRDLLLEAKPDHR